MSLTQTTVMMEVDLTLGPAPRGYGTPLYIRKYIGKAQTRENPYNYAKAAFDDPILVVGRGIVKPSKEVVSRYGGSDVQYDLMILVSRLELLRRFPGAEENDWITKNDRVVFRSNEYLISIAKPSGQIQEYCSLLVLFCNTAKGQKLETP